MVKLLTARVARGRSTPSTCSLAVFVVALLPSTGVSDAEVGDGRCGTTPYKSSKEEVPQLRGRRLDPNRALGIATFQSTSSSSNIFLMHLFNLTIIRSALPLDITA